MHGHDLSLPPVIARLIELLLQAVGRGVRQAARLLGDGHLVRTRMIVRRVSAILRHVILLLAVRLEVKAPRLRAAPSPSAPAKAAHGGRGAAAPTFPLWSAIPASRHPKPAQPDLGSMGGWDGIPNPVAPVWDDDRDGVSGWTEQTIAKKLAALHIALENPLRLARRLARALRGDGIFLPPKVPRTVPKTSEREFWEELVASAQEARFALIEFWRLRRDTS